MTRETDPLVSVITPTYNHEDFIADCVQSVRAQTYTYWEQVVIDDDSTDRTAEITGQSGDRRVRYLHQEHQGIEKLAGSYNTALGQCRGDLIAILEGDDLWPAHKLSKLVSAFKDPSVVLAYGAVGELSPDGTWGGRLTRTVRRHQKLPRSILSNSPVGSATIPMLKGNDLVPPSTVVIRRNALERIGGFQYVPGLCVTDFPTFVRLTLEGSFYYTPEVMGYRRRHLGSVTLNNMDSIANGAYAYAMDFITGHQLRLTVAERRALTRSWSQARSSNEFGKGRLSLVQQDWHKARKHFRRSLDPAQPRFMAASILGWMVSWAHADLEWAARLAGRAAISYSHTR